MNDSPDGTRQRLVSLFESILSTLPSNCASLEIRQSPRDKDFEEVALIPSNCASAEFGSILLRGELYAAFFGRGKRSTTYECPWEIGLHLDDGIEKALAVIEKMCLAVIAGKCEHLLGRVSVKGTIYVVGHNPYRVVDIPIFPLRMHRELVQYAPYCPGAEALWP